MGHSLGTFLPHLLNSNNPQSPKLCPCLILGGGIMGFHKNIRKQIQKIKNEVDEIYRNFLLSVEDVEKKIESKYFEEGKK